MKPCPCLPSSLLWGLLFCEPKTVCHSCPTRRANGVTLNFAPWPAKLPCMVKCMHFPVTCLHFLSRSALSCISSLRFKGSTMDQPLQLNSWWIPSLWDPGLLSAPREERFHQLRKLKQWMVNMWTWWIMVNLTIHGMSQLQGSSSFNRRCRLTARTKTRCLRENVRCLNSGSKPAFDLSAGT